MKEMLRTPVLFLIFNRPDTTQLVFNNIREIKPQSLFVAADGPRENKPDEHKKCEAAQNILNQIDWDCNLHTLFRDKNLGCKTAVSDAITWFFDHVEAGIILEDDCLPHPSFFRYCEELLDRYGNAEGVMMISGDNFQFGRKRTQYSYYFSHYTHVWGWASWRRAWKHYDANVTSWPLLKNKGWLNDWLKNDKVASYWTQIFESVYRGEIDTWDYQWTFSCWKQKALTILPNANLISNIGFAQNGTHTVGDSKFSNMRREGVHFPLHHPPLIIRDKKADNFTFKTHYNPGKFEKFKNKLRRIGIFAL